MRRWAFHFAAAVSLLLLLAMVACRVHPLAFRFWSPQGYCEIAVRDSRIWYDDEPQRQLERDGVRRALAKSSQLIERAHAERARLEATRPKDRAWTLGDYEAEWKVQDMDQGAASLKLLAGRWYARPMRPLFARSVSCGKVALALGVLPAAWPVWLYLHATRRKMLIANQMCANCGYNLTGNESGICPECGTPTTARTRA